MVHPSSAKGYVTHSVTTASPQQLLVMLYDRLILDLDRAEIAVADHDCSRAHEALVHAQDIVAELAHTLDPSTWSGASGLAAVYAFIESHLVEANLRKDRKLIAQCRDLAVPLRDAWAEATSSVNSNVA